MDSRFRQECTALRARSHAAMREAGLEIEDDLLCELEQLMSGIAARFNK